MQQHVSAMLLSIVCLTADLTCQPQCGRPFYSMHAHKRQKFVQALAWCHQAGLTNSTGTCTSCKGGQLKSDSAGQTQTCCSLLHSLAAVVPSAAVVTPAGHLVQEASLPMPTLYSPLGQGSATPGILR